MPNHRFIEELLALEQHPLQGDHNILVVGTFNAEDQLGLNNDAAWFYGRFKNEFWYLFPQILGEDSLHRREHPLVELVELADIWRKFSHDYDVTFIDIYKSIDDVLPNHGDIAIQNPVQYQPFDFETAFADCSFERVLFTWKGKYRGKTIGDIKQNLHDWFAERNVEPLHMVSPSYAYRRSKEAKLEMWQHAYNHLR